MCAGSIEFVSFSTIFGGDVMVVIVW